APAAAQLAVDVPAGVYKVDPTHASVHWRVSHLGLSNYTGRFIRFDATLTIDPAKPEAAKLEASVDPLSLRTDYPFADKKNFDNILATDAKWFNAGAFPAITFKSTAVKMTGPKTAEVSGDVTLLGVTKPLTLKTTLNGGMKEQPFAKKPALGFSAVGTLKRSDFGMVNLIPGVGDEVEIVLEVEFLGGATS
ncbi:MAG: polyisoprenoid-binding protein, partial [Rhodospirillales bacterium]|nr:polyisoprenoid-binding protein [Rhodospirillales bacterium]